MSRTFDIITVGYTTSKHTDKDVREELTKVIRAALETWYRGSDEDGVPNKDMVDCIPDVV